jgi:uncharacterized protein
VAAEQMMVKTFERARFLALQGETVVAPPALQYFLYRTEPPGLHDADEWLPLFMTLDDSDVYAAIKQWQHHDDRVLSCLANGIVDRHLFKATFRNADFTPSELDDYATRILDAYDWLQPEDLPFMFVHDTSRNSAYNKETGQIYILYKDGALKDISEASDQLNISVLSEPVVKYYVCHPALPER